MLLGYLGSGEVLAHMFIFQIQLSGLVILSALRPVGCVFNPQQCYTKDCKHGATASLLSVQGFTVDISLHQS